MGGHGQVSHLARNGPSRRRRRAASLRGAAATGRGRGPDAQALQQAADAEYGLRIFRNSQQRYIALLNCYGSRWIAVRADGPSVHAHGGALAAFASFKRPRKKQFCASAMVEGGNESGNAGAENDCSVGWPPPPAARVGKMKLCGSSEGRGRPGHGPGNGARQSGGETPDLEGRTLQMSTT